MSPVPEKKVYSRVIKLPPAIGDWTTIQYRDSEYDNIQILPVRTINFDSVPKDKMRTAHYLHYRLAEQLVQKLSQDMDIKIELHTVSVSQLGYDDFVKAQELRVVQANFAVDQLGKVQVILDWDLADSMVDRLTGGKGEESGAAQFSEIEVHILQAQMEELVPLFVNAWKSVFKADQIRMEFGCGAYQTDKKISPRDVMVVFEFTLSFANGQLKRLMWAYPAEVLRRCMTLRSQITSDHRPRIQLTPSTLRSLQVDVRAVLGRTTLTMSELNHLQPGDVVPLDSSLKSPLDILLGEDIKLHGQAGTHHNHMCVQLIFLENGGQETMTVSSTQAMSQPSVAADSSKLAASTVLPVEQPAFPSRLDQPAPEPESFQDFGQEFGGGFGNFGFEEPAPTQAQPAVAIMPEEEEDDEWGAPESQQIAQNEVSDAYMSQHEEDLDEFEEDEDEEDDIEEFGEQAEEWALDQEEAAPHVGSPVAQSESQEEDDFSWDDLDDHV